MKLFKYEGYRIVISEEALLLKPFKIVIILIIVVIRRAINIIEFILAPIHIINIGPRATFGKLFKIVKYGSNTFFKKSFHHNILAITILIIIDKKKLNIVSYNVINI